jgi:hypothetical protein
MSKRVGEWDVAYIAAGRSVAIKEEQGGAIYKVGIRRHLTEEGCRQGKGAPGGDF